MRHWAARGGARGWDCGQRPALGGRDGAAGAGTERLHGPPPPAPASRAPHSRLPTSSPNPPASSHLPPPNQTPRSYGPRTYANCCFVKCAGLKPATDVVAETACRLGACATACLKEPRAPVCCGGKTYANACLAKQCHYAKDCKPGACAKSERPFGAVLFPSRRGVLCGAGGQGVCQRVPGKAVPLCQGLQARRVRQERAAAGGGGVLVWGGGAAAGGGDTRASVSAAQAEGGSVVWSVIPHAPTRGLAAPSSPCVRRAVRLIDCTGPDPGCADPGPRRARLRECAARGPRAAAGPGAPPRGGAARGPPCSLHPARWSARSVARARRIRFVALIITIS